MALYAASLTTAKAGTKISSNVSPSFSLFLNSWVLAFNSKSVNLLISSSNAKTSSANFSNFCNSLYS